MGSICSKSKTRVTDAQREAEEYAIAVNDRLTLGPGIREPGADIEGQGQLASELRRSWMLSIGLDPDRIEDVSQPTLRTYGSISNEPRSCHQSPRACNKSLMQSQFRSQSLREMG